MLKSSLLALGLSCAVAMGLAACTNSETTTPQGDSTSASAEAAASIPADAPKHVVVASSDIAALARDIVPAEQLAAMPEPALEGVAAIKADSKIDPEQLLSYTPDLVLITPRHQGEHDAIAQLKNTGLKVTELSKWGTPQDLADNARTIGKTTGQTKKAEEIATTIEESVKKAAEKYSSEPDSPRVLTLMARGPMRMAMGPDLMMNELIRLSHGTPIADEAGFKATMPIDAERIKSLNPDLILVEDFRGRGKEDFAEILGAPALKDIRVVYLPDTTTGASAGAQIAEGLTAVGEAIHEHSE